MYSSDYMSGLEEVLGAEGMSMATTMMAVLLIAYFLLMAVAILNYVFISLSLYTVGKRRGLRLYGMGWVPIGQQWLMGCIADQYDRKAKGKDMKLGRFLLIGYIVALVVAIAATVALVVGALGMLTAEIMGAASAEPTGSLTALVISAIVLVLVYLFLIVWTVFYYIALYKFFKSCSPKNAAWMLILSIFSGLGCAICMLCVRKKDGGFEALPQDALEQEDASEVESAEEQPAETEE